MQILHVSPVLPTDVCTQAMALANRDWLSKLYTSTAVNAQTGAGRLLARWMDRRSIPICGNKLHAVVLADCVEKWHLLVGKSRVEATDARFRSVDRAASLEVDGKTDAVFCREDAAYETFRRAADAGTARIYDLPTAHFTVTRNLVNVETECFPDLADSFSIPEVYAPRRLSRKEAELHLADYILCPSHFVKRSLVTAGVSGDKIHVIPFGCNPNGPLRSPQRRHNIVLYVGQISARKGVHRLLRVWKRLGAHRSHRLRLIGAMRLPRSFLKEYTEVYEHVPEVPRANVVDHYATAKLFVANFMSEGMSVVIPEALSAGTPVIATRNSGGEEIITENQEGLLIDYGDDDALATAIDSLLSSPERLAYMSNKASEKARSWTWNDYSRSFAEWVHTILSGMTSEARERAML